MRADPLVSALRADKSTAKPFYTAIPQGMMLNKSFDMNTLGMTFFQRTLCFLVCLGSGMLSFLYSMIKILRFSPSGFIIPYTVSNVLFFAMFGFLLGFKSYFKNLFSKKKRAYTSWFIWSTVMTLYMVLKYNTYVLNLIFCLAQVISFLTFSLTFIPGGVDGISTMVSMLFNKK